MWTWSPPWGQGWTGSGQLPRRRNCRRTWTGWIAPKGSGLLRCTFGYSLGWLERSWASCVHPGSPSFSLARLYSHSTAGTRSNVAIPLHPSSSWPTMPNSLPHCYPAPLGSDQHHAPSHQNSIHLLAYSPASSSGPLPKSKDLLHLRSQLIH